MLSGKSLYLSRSAFYVFSTIFKDDTLNNVNATNHAPLTHSLIDLSLQHDKGVMQHKATLMKHLISHQFTAGDTIEYYKTTYPNVTNKLHFEPNALTDLRISKEIPLIHEYLKHFNEDISWTLATLDSRPASFPHQVQTNRDFWVMLKTKMDRSMGLGYKCVSHDEKSGMDMFRHSSKGAIGLLTYDAATGENVEVLREKVDPTTNVRISPSYEYLIQHDRRQFGLLEQTFKTDNLSNSFKKTIEETWSILHDNTIKPLDVHNKYQQFLWDNIQRDPRYTRSISFIFTKEVNFEPLQDKALAFHDRFVKLLGTKQYNLDKRGDFDTVYKAMLIAYKDTVDPKIFEKVYYLQRDAGIMFNDKFMLIVDLLKRGLF